MALAISERKPPRQDDRTAVDPADVAKIPAPSTVLVVDDERLIRWSVRQGLTRRGHTVFEAPSAAETVQLLMSRTAAFDVILLDYRLPDRQDLTLLREIRALSPESVVFMMTAYGEGSMRTGALALGARAVIDKPFQVGAVVTLIETATIR